MHEVLDMDHHLVAPVGVECWRGNAPVDGHCMPRDAVGGCSDFINLQPVLPDDAGFGSELVVVGVDVVVAPLIAGVGGVASAGGGS